MVRYVARSSLRTISLTIVIGSASAAAARSLRAGLRSRDGLDGAIESRRGDRWGPVIDRNGQSCYWRRGARNRSPWDVSNRVARPLLGKTRSEPCDGRPATDSGTEEISNVRTTLSTASPPGEPPGRPR